MSVADWCNYAWEKQAVCINRKRVFSEPRVRVLWMGNWCGIGKKQPKKILRAIKHMANSDLKARTMILSDNDIDVFNAFSSTCYLPYYREGKSWDNADAENYSAVNFAAEQRVAYDDEKFISYNTPTYRPGYSAKRRPCAITTVYSTVLGKRLVVDGVHRLVAMINQTIRNKAMLQGIEIIIRELYGPMVHLYFPHDFSSMIVRELLNSKDASFVREE